MQNRLLLPLGIISALGLVSPGWAQERPNGLFLTSPVSLSSGYDDNFTARNQTLDDTVTILTTPTLSWYTSTHRSFLSFDYQGEFEIFSRHESLDAWNHAANAHFRHRFNSRWSIDGAESFLYTMDPTRSLINSLLLLPRGRYEENSFYTRLAYKVNRSTVVSARFDNAYTTMDLPSFVATRLDRLGLAGTLSVDHSFNSHHAISGSYSYLYVHPLGGDFGAINTTANNAVLGYIYTVNSGLTLRASGGVTHSIQNSFTGAAAVDKKVGQMWLSAGYQRYLSFLGGLTPNTSFITGPVTSPVTTPTGFGTGFASNSIYQVVALRAWGNITNRFGMEGNVQRALNGVTTDNRGIKSVMLQLRLNYKLNDRVTLFTRTDFYGQNVSEFQTFPLSRRRYFAGLEFTLARAPELTDNPRRRKPAPDEPDSQETGRAQEK